MTCKAIQHSEQAIVWLLSLFGACRERRGRLKGWDGGQSWGLAGYRGSALPLQSLQFQKVVQTDGRYLHQSFQCGSKRSKDAAFLVVVVVCVGGGGCHTFLYAAEIFKILTNCEHPGRNDKKKREEKK